MIYYHLLILGLIQGITEFLPISSSAHLILLPQLAGWEDQGLIYDMAAHLGSLFAIVYYFRADLQRMATAWFRSLASAEEKNTDALLAWYVILATLPIMIAGFILYDLVSTVFRDPLIIATTTIVFALLLWWADRSGRQQRPINHLSLKHALWIGVLQVLALIPGTSRSGITMTAGLLLGYSRTAAARFSFYLSIPTILMACAHTLLRYMDNAVAIDPLAFLLVMSVSAVSAGFVIHCFLGFIERTGMFPYVIYRLLLGLFLLFVFLPQSTVFSAG